MTPLKEFDVGSLSPLCAKGGKNWNKLNYFRKLPSQLIEEMTWKKKIKTTARESKLIGQQDLGH